MNAAEKMRQNMIKLENAARRAESVAVDQRTQIDRLKAELEKANDKPITMLKAMAEGTEHCDMCGKPATCLGAYESEENLGFACDECCGHGNEDGWCVQVNASVSQQQRHTGDAVSDAVSGASRVGRP